MFQIDERWFEILAQSPSAIIARHKISGNLIVWKLDWIDAGNFPDSFSTQAWSAYLKYSSNAVV